MGQGRLRRGSVPCGGQTERFRPAVVWSLEMLQAAPGGIRPQYGWVPDVQLQITPDSAMVCVVPRAKHLAVSRPNRSSG